MKILIYGSAYPYALESFYEKKLTILGHKVKIFNGADVFVEYYKSSIINKLFFRIGLSLIYYRINKTFLNTLNYFKPECILVFKGMELFPRIIEKISKKNIPIFNYNPDHPFLFHGKGSGNKNVQRAIPFYTCHISYSKKICCDLINKYKVNCEWIPFGYEPVKVFSFDENSEIKKLCFIGHADLERARMIKKISKAGISIDIYGPNWFKYLRNINNLTIHDPIYNEKMNEIAQKYRVQLNMFRFHNIDSHNMRTFEMSGIGCIVIAPDSIEHRMFYKENEEHFLYKDFDDLLIKTKKILNMPFIEALKIRQGAYHRSIQSKYTYLHRAIELISVLEKYV